MSPPPKPMPTRVVYFVDGQNFYHRCREHFGHPWVHPRRLGEALVGEDQERHGPGSHVLSAVRYYTGIHDPNRRPDAHGAMARRLQAYTEQGIQVFPMPLRYDHRSLGREKGVDVRIAIDLTRLRWKGLYDVAVIVSEDSDLDPAAQDVYALRDSERWVAVENALPWTPTSHTQWLPSVKRRRPIDADLFEEVRDDHVY